MNSNPAKALVKLGIEGNHYTSWRTQAGKGAFGESVVKYNGKLYLGAGGDFVAQYDKEEAAPATGRATPQARRRWWGSWTVSW